MPRFFSIENIILFVIYFLISFIIIYFISNYFIKDKKIQKFFIPAYLFKILMGLAFALVYEYYYKWLGDSFYYYKNSCALGDLFFTNTEIYFKMLFGWINYSNIYTLPADIGYLPRSDASVYAVHRLISPFSIIGLKNYYLILICLNSFLFLINWKFFRFLQKEYPDKTKIIAIVLLFFPSVYFWGSGIMKDALTFSFTLLFILCFYKIVLKFKFKIKYFILFALSFYILKELKPYILYSLIISCIVLLAFTYLNKFKNKIIKFLFFPFVLILAGTLGIFFLQRVANNVGGVYSSVDSMLRKASAAQLDLKQDYYQGNSFDIGDLEPTVSSAVAILPAAIIAGLLRPFIWEVRSVSMVLSGIENLILLLIILYTIFYSIKKSILYSYKILINNPFLIFCLIFSLTMAAIVGLSTSNFGALARFKIPFLTFFTLFWLFLYDELKKKFNNLKGGV